MSSTNNCAFLETLPAELRVRIYEYALQYNGVIERISPGGPSPSPWLKSANPGIIRACRQVHEEAIDVFYELNTFKVQYVQVCTCSFDDDRDWRRKVAAFDAQRIRNLRISSFDPGAYRHKECATCQNAGLGLIEHLAGLPKLRSVTIDFEFVFGFDLFADRLRVVNEQRGTPWELIGSEVGSISVIGLSKGVTLRMPALVGAWRRLSGNEERSQDTEEQLIGEESIEKALEYLQFESDAWGRVPISLKRFFVASGGDGSAKLRLRNAADPGKRLTDFTIALTEILSDIFMADGGSGSITWGQLTGPMSCVKWLFAEGCKT